MQLFVMPVIVAVVPETVQLPETFANVTTPPPDPPEWLRVTVVRYALVPSKPFVRATSGAWVALPTVIVALSVCTR
jgi:hypothetical protein